MHPKKRGRSEVSATSDFPANVTPAASVNVAGQQQPVALHYHNVLQTTVKQLPFKRGAQREPMMGSDRAWHVSNISNNSEHILGAVVNPNSSAEASQDLVGIPAHTTEWFNMASIHPLEQRALPEFFSGRTPSKTPAIYKEYRDFMIHAYQQNPAVYLTVTAWYASPVFF